jgi:CRISPR-associated endonuclease/helicase Cas3
VSASVREDTLRVGLLHSRFPFQRRADLEEDRLEHLGPNRPASSLGSVLVATQVVEQSVDIDFDFIVSDLAPSDMLLQRVGRLWRHERRRHTAVPEFWVRLPELSSTFNAVDLKKSLGRSGTGVSDPQADGTAKHFCS